MSNGEKRENGNFLSKYCLKTFHNNSFINQIYSNNTFIKVKYTFSDSVQLLPGYITGDSSDLVQSKRDRCKVDFDDAFVQELIEKIETLTNEKSDISHQLLQANSSQEESNKKVNILSMF